jgi:hypothetical protein
MASKREEIELSIEDAARGWGVSTNTVRNLIESGRLEVKVVNGVTRISLSAYESAKVFRNHQLLARPDVLAAGVVERDLTDALVAGAVKPSEAPDRRFSIQDERALLAWHAGEWGDDGADEVDVDEAATPALRPELPASEVPEVHEPASAARDELTRSTPLVERAKTPITPADFAETQTFVTPKHWDELSLYIRTGNVGALETYFDDAETCPPFVPPAHVFRYEVRGTFWRKDGSYTYLLRTAGFQLGDEGQIYAEPLQVLEEIGELPERFLPGHYARSNLEYQTCQRAWERAWRKRRIAILRREGNDDTIDAVEETSDSHDLIEFERWYHDQRKRPEEAPDWVFCLPEPRPYLPRTNVARYSYGNWLFAANGRVFTQIVRSEAWMANGLRRPRYSPAEPVDWEWGYFAFGSPPTRYAEQNREAELDRQAWEIETEVRRKRRGLA